MAPYPNFDFKVIAHAVNSAARLGKIHTPHGVVDTPAFIFCATKAAIKGLTPQQMHACGTQFILSNTYHLMLQPGAERIEKLGGLHKFMNWSGPMLTDSGGYQIFSLGHGSVSEEIKGKRLSPKRRSLQAINEEGATFKSYLDGSQHLLTPERSIQIQRALGADLIVVLDECTPFNVDKEYTEQSLELTHRWALRSLLEFQRTTDGRQALYGIIQGGVYPDLRQRAVEFVNTHPFFGTAIGGSLGAAKNQMYDIVALTMAATNKSRPVHLLGIGGIRDIFFGVRHGIDSFDCVHPTRLARHGGALVRAQEEPERWAQDKEFINLNNAIHRDANTPIDTSCACPTCTNFSRAYIHHLLKAQELLGMILLTQHNVFYMNRLLADIRHGIATNTLHQVEKCWVN